MLVSWLVYFNRYKNKYITEILKLSLFKHLTKLLLLGVMLINMSLSVVASGYKDKPQVPNSPLTIALNKTSFPYQHLDEDGHAAGIMPDLWRLWAKKQSVDIKFVELPWLETIARVEKGKVDIHAGLSIIESRQKTLAFTQSLFPLYTHVFVSAELSQVSNMEELSPYAIGVVNGSAHIDMLAKSFPQLEQKMYQTRHELYQAALQRDILVFTGLEKLPTNYEHYQRLTSMFPPHKRLRYQQGKYGVAVAKNNHALLEFINQGLAKITSEEKSEIERKWLGIDKRNDSLSIGFSPDYPPYSALSPTGQPQGLFIDIWRLWAKHTDTKINFFSSDVADNFDLIEQNKLDALIGMPEEWLDKNKFFLAKPIYQLQAKVFVNTKFSGIDSLHYFEKDNTQNRKQKQKLGIWYKSPFKSELKRKYPKITIQEYPSISALLKAAELNEIDAFVAQIDFMNLKLLRANLQSLFYTLDEPIFNSVISPLLKKGNSRLANIIDEGFKHIPLEQLASMENRWLNGGVNYYKKLLEKVFLTHEEREFISQNRQIDVGVLKSREPVEFINTQGEFSGIDRDILDLIAERTELDFNFIAYDSLHQLEQGILAGELDVIPSYTPTKSRKSQLVLSTEYWQTPWAILHPQYLGTQSKLRDFNGKKLAIVKGVYLIDYIQEHHPLIKLKIVKDREEGLLLLQQGKIEGYIDTVTSASQLLKQESLVSLMLSLIEGMQVDRSHFGIHKEKKELQSIFNKALMAISGEEKNKIYEKWFSIDINTGFDKDVVKRVALQALILILVVLVIIILWNRRLNREIKHRVELEKSMKHMATHDDLTGLANRVLLTDRINTAIEFHQRQSLMLAVLFLDLDGFKEVNDTYGHNVGDELLLIVAQRLKSCVRKSDTVVRFGGDEFVLLLTGLHAANEAAYVAEKVLELMQLPFELSADTVQIGCSIGIALYPENGLNETDLLKEADVLMYQVKSAGKNHYRFKSN